MSEEIVANFTLNNTSLNAQYELSEGEQIDATFKIYANATVWGTIEGDIADQTDLIDLIDTKIDIEATARENNDLALQNGINTLNDDLTAEISNRGTADGILQDNIDTLSGIVTSNYTTLDGKISNNKTAIDNHITDKTNPHEVTKEQIGLGNVDNTSDLNKPISTATQNALNTKVSNTREINGYSLSSDITLTASDVNALPDTTKYAASMNLSIDSSTYVITAQLKDQNGDNLGTTQTIDLPLESVVVGGSYDSTNKKVVLTLQDGSTIEFSVADLVSGLQTEITSSNKLDADLVDDSTSVNKFATSSQLSQISTNTSDISTINGTTINGNAIGNGNITLTASDVGALPDSTTIGNGTLTIQKNGSTIDTFGANDTGNTTVNITVPTDTSDLTNGAGFITGITGTDVTNALGYTPADESDLATVATSGSYNDLSDKPTIPAAQVNSDWNASSGVAQILNKPTLSTVAKSGSYNDLTNKPTIPTVGNGTITINQGGVQKGTFTTNQSGNTTIDLDSGGSDIEVDDELSTTSENPVQNKIITNALENKANKSDLSTVATTGDYDDLSNKPTIPAEQVNSDWNATSGKAQILNKPSLSTVATSGSYNDLSDKPTIPSAVTESTVSDWGFTKNTGTVTSVNNVSPVNGNVSLSIPTATSDLTNDSGYITGITLSDVTTALGYTPYNSSNPSGYISSSSSYVASSRFDGQWVAKTQTLSTATAVGTYTIDLSSYLPNDNYNYEVILVHWGSKSDKSGSHNGHVYSDLISSTNSLYTIRLSTYTRGSTCSIILPVKRYVYKYIEVHVSDANDELQAIGYRRIGTNV